jgi:hypothetical protein
MGGAMRKKIKRGNVEGLEIKKTGFMRIYPHARHKLRMRQQPITGEFEKFIIKKGPFYFYISLTFAINMRRHQSCYYVDTFIHRYNNKIFGRGYKDFVKGFAFIEDHPGGKSKNDIHFHLLIKSHKRYDDFYFNQHNSIFHETASKIVDDRGRRVFNDKCIKIRYYYEEGEKNDIEYSLKQIYDENLDDIKPIGKEGLSDHQ